VPREDTRSAALAGDVTNRAVAAPKTGAPATRQARLIFL
jgi:hypothetical protein